MDLSKVARYYICSLYLLA